MPIVVSCGACRKQFTVPDHYAGKSGKCTQCGATILAPANPIKTGSDEQLVAFGEPVAMGPRPSVSIGSELAGCKLQKRLGSEKSTVFLAQGPKGPGAIKGLPREITEKTPVAAKRFLREARALFNLEHPNVATCLDAGEELGTLYMVLELFGGRTVKELMAERGGKVPTAEALEIGLQIARGLEFFNEQKLVHRNVKPEHILVDGEGHAKLVGLGLVKSEDSDQAVTMKGVAVGTPQYMSPEQGRGDRDIDIRSDLFSLGITLYEMLAGELPWFNKAPLKNVQMIEHDPVPPLREKNATVSPTAVLVVEKLLAKKKEARYQTPAELVSDLEAIEEGTLVQGKPPSFVQSSPSASAASRGTRSAGATAEAPGDFSVQKLRYAIFLLAAVILALLFLVVALLIKR